MISSSNLLILVRFSNNHGYCFPDQLSFAVHRLVNRNLPITQLSISNILILPALVIFPFSFNERPLLSNSILFAVFSKGYHNFAGSVSTKHQNDSKVHDPTNWCFSNSSFLPISVQIVVSDIVAVKDQPLFPDACKQFLIFTASRRNLVSYCSASPAIATPEVTWSGHGLL
jgi:hypothetical protein